MKKEQISTKEFIVKKKQVLKNKQVSKEKDTGKEERILNALGEVDEKYIAEAAPSREAGTKAIWLRWGALAACAALIFSAGVRLIQAELPGRNPASLPGNTPGDNPAGLPDSSSEHPTEGGAGSPSALPLLTISENTYEAAGYEGYMAYDISDLINANPWNEAAELSALPVFRNTLSYDTDIIVSGADFDAMESFLLEIAARLHMNTDTLEITDNTPNAEEQAIITEKSEGKVPEGYFNPTALIAKQNGIKIEVDVSMTATITFEPAITLPNGYSFTHYSSYDDILAVAEYLREAYSDLIAMEEPLMNIDGGDYNIYRQQMYHITFFDTAENLTQQILNYQFNRVAFYCNDEEKFYMARVFRPNLSDKAGDYPIISTQEATDLLLNGNYITTVPCEMPGQEYIAGMELVYRSGKHEEYYMPYYRFYVELPEMEQEDGLKDYGAYYVPAVRQEYLTNMPVWNGDFN